MPGSPSGLRAAEFSGAELKNRYKYIRFATEKRPEVKLLQTKGNGFLIGTFGNDGAGDGAAAGYLYWMSAV
jgi:hypothetical protein